MSKLIQHWNFIYYSDVIVLVAECLALTVAIICIKKDIMGKLFIFYISLDALILLIDWYHTATNMPVNGAREFTRKSNLIIGLTELLAYSFYFNKILLNGAIKRVMKINFILFATIVIIYFASQFDFVSDRAGYISYLIGVLEFIFLIIPSLAYFRQLFEMPFSVGLLDRPSFWIVTGIFFFSLVSIPFYLICKYFTEIMNVPANALTAALYYTPFALNFIFLTKAFLCKKLLVI